MKYFKPLTIGLLSSAIAFVFIYGGYTIFAQENEEAPNPAFEEFTDPSREFVHIKISYHEAMNDFFNAKIEEMVSILENPAFYKDKSSMARLNAPTDEEECKEDNLSTYCVSMQGLEMFLAYVETLEIVRGQLISDMENETEWIWLYDDELESMDSLLMAHARKNQLIDEEISKAQQVLEATLGAYNEFRLAYPMHIKYENIISDLRKYRKALEIMREDIARFPGKFIDASSATCE
ncbi:hypothetical protein GF354_01280 [Candidatus Peregrinibacteria bacterium]|nr:hypothetical protein [Candidatus Peregrinibacteria bacterium]